MSFLQAVHGPALTAKLTLTKTKHPGIQNKQNKAIVEYTSPALCTPVTPFPPTGNAACRPYGEGGPSH